MQKSRRNFIKLTGLSALAFTTPIKNLSAMMKDEIFLGKNISDFGIQLWTVKEDLAINPKDVLTQLAGFGYKQIESFEGKQGMYWGMTNKEFKSHLDSIGSKIISSHCDTKTDFERKAAEAAEIGMKYLICPHKGAQKSIDDFKKFADEFNKNGEICRKNGIRFAYHNHDYSWKTLDGKIPQEVMMDNTDKDLVDFEMDIYWVVAAGIDPQEYLKKYAHRFRLCHVKDLTNFNGKNESCQLGKGTIDYATILSTAAATGMKYYIVEQEAFTNTNPMESAKADGAYMKAFRFK